MAISSGGPFLYRVVHNRVRFMVSNALEMSMSGTSESLFSCTYRSILYCIQCGGALFISISAYSCQEV